MSTMTIKPDGTQVWRNAAGRLHREDGPAMISTLGQQAWWVNGLQHRDDGPAVIFADGGESWYLHSKSITLDVIEWLRETGYERPFTTEQLMHFRLRFT